MAFFVLRYMMKAVENRSGSLRGPGVTRRECLRFMAYGGGLMLAMPFSMVRAAEVRSGPDLIEKYLGEQLRYQIGYWLIDHVGDARTGFISTDISGVYKISLAGQGVGLINFLLGGVTYVYTSFCRYLPDQDRLQPVYFELKKMRGTTQSLRSIRYHYRDREIIFEQTSPAGKTRLQKEPMKTDRIYEDYLTLFYNFRHGYYGPLKRNRQYRLPLYTQEKMAPVKLDLADFEMEERMRKRETKPVGKDYFIRFQINPEDVSSGSGRVFGWLSADAVPVKGTIEDVAFFGDLWGDLQVASTVTNGRPVRVPDVVKDSLR